MGTPQLIATWTGINVDEASDDNPGEVRLDPTLSRAKALEYVLYVDPDAEDIKIAFYTWKDGKLDSVVDLV